MKRRHSSLDDEDFEFFDVGDSPSNLRQDSVCFIKRNADLTDERAIAKKPRTRNLNSEKQNSDAGAEDDGLEISANNAKKAIYLRRMESSNPVIHVNKLPR